MKEQDFIYKKENNIELMLTYLPPIKEVYKKSPLYFIIPGGGWRVETRQSMIEFSELSVKSLREKGFSVVSIDYRVTKDGISNMYDILEDCFDAVSYISKSSEKLGIDMDNVVFSGHSAGAHLALMLAYSDPKRFSKNDKNYTAKGIAVMSAPTILYDDSTNSLRSNLDDAFRNCEISKAAKETSPFEYVSEASPKTLLFAGEKDSLVYPVSSERLYKKLLDCGVESRYIVSLNAGHSFEKVGDNTPSIPMEEIQEEITKFALSAIDK